MKGIRVSSAGLGHLLSPLAWYLDDCWWYFGGDGARLWEGPVERPASPQDFRDAEALWARWVDDSHGVRVGRRGFFSRYADRVDFVWTTQFASDSPECPHDAFAKADDTLSRLDRPEALPLPIFLMARDVDGAYTELFFREDWAFHTVWPYLLGRSQWPAKEI